jgi:PTS system nitrogen regulatory IIA component
MLFIAMHNDDNCLDKIESILNRSGILNILRIHRDRFASVSNDLGDGTGVEHLLSQSKFEKALISSFTDHEFIRNNEKLKNIEKRFFSHNEGFICSLPYEKIIHMVAKERREGFMKVATHLNPKFICTELKATTKEGAIHELADFLKDCPEINNFDQLLNDILERESLMTTGIGNGIAVPHARTNAVDKLIIAMGRSRSGIDFHAIDNQPVKLIFLMGAPVKDMSEYLRTLAYLTRILAKEKFRTELLEVNDPEGIIEIFMNKETANS